MKSLLKNKGLVPSSNIMFIDSNLHLLCFYRNVRTKILKCPPIFQVGFCFYPSF